MDSELVHEEVTRRFGSAASPNPARTGVAYMVAPIMRGYTHGPRACNDEHASLHVLRILDMGRGRDDYIILLAGEAEKTKIIADSKDLLTDLCSFRDYLCSTAATQARTPVN
jgi:hypothetical protein